MVIWNIILVGVFAALIAGLGASIGALTIFFKKEISIRTLDILMGLAAGVMLAASFFSLILPALELENGGGIWIVTLGLILGALLIALIDKLLPHSHFEGGEEGPRTKKVTGIWLFVIAIAIHNFPEGLAVGVSFGTGEFAPGLIVALAIGLHNIPEGAAIAFPLLRENYSKKKAFFVATLTGLVEPIGAFLGLLLVSIAEIFLGIGLAFAAGAMIFVVIDEIIPETHTRQFSREVTFAILVGFIFMMILDILMEPFLMSFF